MGSSSFHEWLTSIHDVEVNLVVGDLRITGFVEKVCDNAIKFVTVNNSNEATKRLYILKSKIDYIEIIQGKRDKNGRLKKGGE